MAKYRTPAVLIVRDGWGRNPNSEHDKFNAVKLANTPAGDELLKKYPWTLIHTSGEDVGLPEGTMGNSEVGHQNLGAGRVVDQESVRVTKAIRDGSFFKVPALVDGINKAKENGKTVHLMGIASDAGVHGLMVHLYACLELCKKLGAPNVALHLFTDGRDTGPYTGKNFIEEIEAKCKEIGVGRIASICGRYYAMDRDNRWERVKRAYDMLTGRGDCKSFASAAEAIQDYYDHPTNDSQNGDEFITPRCIGDASKDRLADGDTVIFYNYRGDRPREIIRSLVMPEFYGHVKPSPDSGEKGFDRGQKLDLFFVTLTAYEEVLSQWVHVAYLKPPKMTDIVGETISKLGLTQFRCAETEKYPHVTFFFNDYRDQPFPGETQEMAQSPKVATYDMQPEMSAPQVRDLVLAQLKSEKCPDFILVNFANGDMVGHTGKLDAAIKAVETVDACVNEIVKATLAKDGVLIVTADHGNAEQMFDPETGSPHTAHTTYDVECIVVDPRMEGTGSSEEQSPLLRQGGRLPDVAVTLMQMMGIEKPAAMTAESLIK